MKILHLLLFSFLIFLSLYAQNPEWTVYTTSNSGLPFNYIKSIAIDKSGNKWIGTNGGGLVKFDGTNWTVYTIFNSSLSTNYILSTVIDGSGNKWIGTNGGGLVKFDGTNWTLYSVSNSGLPDSYVWSIAIDSLGNKWIGTSGGLAKFDGTNWTVYTTSNSGLPYNTVNRNTIDGLGNIWIGTFTGLAKFDGTNWTVYTTSNSGLPNNNVWSITIDSSGSKWIGTGGYGLAKFDGTTWTVYTTSNSGLPNNNVWSITIDRSGSKWIGTIGGGLAKFDGTNWTVYTTSNSGLPDNFDESIAIDGSGNKWIGTRGGLAVYSGGGILPVELVSFSASVKDKTVNLIWKTATEVNNYGFEIQRSTSNGSFSKIGFIVGNGNSSSVKEYSFNDKMVLTGEYLYRLKQIDYAGTYKYSKEIDVNVNQAPTEFALDQNFPNPWNPSTKINYNLPFHSKVTLEIYNITGERIGLLVNEEQSAGYYSVDFGSSNLSSGVYFYRITAVDKATGNNFSAIKKMILIK